MELLELYTISSHAFKQSKTKRTVVSSSFSRKEYILENGWRGTLTQHAIQSVREPLDFLNVNHQAVVQLNLVQYVTEQ